MKWYVYVYIYFLYLVYLFIEVFLYFLISFWLTVSVFILTIKQRCDVTQDRGITQRTISAVMTGLNLPMMLLSTSVRSDPVLTSLPLCSPREE